MSQRLPIVAGVQFVLADAHAQRLQLAGLAEAFGEEVQRLLEGSQRGLDVQLRLRNDEGRRVLLVLLPLTSAEGSQGYLQRLRILFAERFGQACSPRWRGRYSAGNTAAATPTAPISGTKKARLKRNSGLHGSGNL